MRPSMKPNNEYDPFARIYNRYWGREYRSKAFPLLKRLLLNDLQPNASVLDVCCGTGQLTHRVSQLAFQVSGIDASAGMLAYARKNAPEADLHVADARRFSLGKQFDGAFSVFESLNHIPDINDLTRAFRNVRRHLKPGCAFLFDLNNDDAFRLYWNTVDALVEDDATCVLRMNYEDETRIGTCRFTAFERIANEWQGMTSPFAKRVTRETRCRKRYARPALGIFHFMPHPMPA